MLNIIIYSDVTGQMMKECKTKEGFYESKCAAKAFQYLWSTFFVNGKEKYVF